MDESRNQAEDEAVEAFIDRWSDTGGKERAKYQLFLTELCQLLNLPGPEPAGPDPKANSYVFERRVDIHHADGTVNRGYGVLHGLGVRSCFMHLALLQSLADPVPSTRSAN